MRALTIIMLSGMAVYGQNGQAVEAPKRTVFDSKGQDAKKPPAPVVDTAKPAGAAGASYRALDALSSSTEDMNAIRDSNVRKLTKDGCAPEVTARIADLRSKLQIAGVAPDAMEKRARREDSVSDSSTLALASNWFKATGDGKMPAARDRSMELLDSVMPAAAGTTKEERPPIDVTKLKTELDQLYDACPGAKR